MCSKSVSRVKTWYREGVTSAESVSLSLVAHSVAQAAVAFSTFRVYGEVFWLKYDSFCDYLSADIILWLKIIVVVAF